MAFTPVSLTTKYDLSRNGVMTIGTVELEGFKSASISFQADSVDNTTRDDGDWGVAYPSRRNATLSITCNKVVDGSDECQAGIRDLWLNENFGTKAVQIIYRSENGSTSKGSGFKGIFILTGYSESQQFSGEAVEISLEFQSCGAIVADDDDDD